MSLVSILSLGFLLGIKHSLEPDHVIAVATTAGNTKKLSRSTLTGVYWGIGHTCTLFLIGMLFIWMKGEIPESLSMTLEFGVGIMLVMLGAKNLFKNRHNITNDKVRFRPFVVSALIGFVHGLAGSAAMVILTMSTVTGIGEGSIYIIIFGAGTIIGMLCFTTLLGIPFALNGKDIVLNRIFIKLAGAISFAFGLYYIYKLGVAEGLFALWAN
ncbi:urease accessory protein UreH [Peribacillus simplex]|nr:urease accessory protein UreH [Peribacillus simplex]MEC1395742.1 urease accessory protein UreH [Peribacillus simplex]MED3986569.1 urease accessory protein UreH [Peribacillus simplex]MED4096647.1 urease accessory protein UreH [Peribacillus simplex]TVX83995.1 urease accessory protein UreH [Peribacillus simplex]